MHIRHSSTEYGKPNQQIRTKNGYQNTYSGNVKAQIDGNRKLIDDSKVIIDSIRNIKYSIYKLDNVQIFPNINQITDLKVEVTTGMSNKISSVKIISNTSETIAQKSNSFLNHHSTDFSINVSTDDHINDPIVKRGNENKNKRNISTINMNRHSNMKRNINQVSDVNQQ